MICEECGVTHAQPLIKGQPVHWWPDLCHWCGEFTDVTDSFEFGVFNDDYTRPTKRPHDGAGEYGS